MRLSGSSECVYSIAIGDIGGGALSGPLQSVCEVRGEIAEEFVAGVERHSAT